jgi:hypothetical protein
LDDEVLGQPPAEPVRRLTATVLPNRQFWEALRLIGLVSALGPEPRTL